MILDIILTFRRRVPENYLNHYIVEEIAITEVLKFIFSSAGSLRNFCRNPDHDPQGPWCYIKSGDPAYRYVRSYCYGSVCPLPYDVTDPMPVLPTLNAPLNIGQWGVYDISAKYPPGFKSWQEYQDWEKEHKLEVKNSTRTISGMKSSPQIGSSPPTKVSSPPTKGPPIEESLPPKVPSPLIMESPPQNMVSPTRTAVKRRRPKTQQPNSTGSGGSDGRRRPKTQNLDVVRLM